MNKKILGIFVCCILLAITVPFTTVTDAQESTLINDITIHKPEKGNLYIMGAQVISLPSDWIVILGPITVEAYVTGIDGFKVDFYIDGEFKIRDQIPPFEYSWWDFSFGKHTIEVELLQDDEVCDSDSVQVFKLF